MVKVYPIECYVQRQQLKFLWKIVHLGDLALQRIILHSKLDPQYSNGRGGRQRTYKQCIKDALGNFGVTMEQCMAMKRQDWDLNIEGIGLETAGRHDQRHHYLSIRSGGQWWGRSKDDRRRPHRQNLPTGQMAKVWNPTKAWKRKVLLKVPRTEFGIRDIFFFLVLGTLCSTFENMSFWY